MMIADTDVLIDFLAGREPAAGRIALELEAGGLRTTAVTRVELLAGARSARQEGKVRALLDSMPALPLDEPAADRAAKVRRDLDGAGLSIGMGDALIAGIVLAHRGTLLTRNARHFRRVPGLALSTLAGES
jgi:predicted nucleic acid-binding protein